MALDDDFRIRADAMDDTIAVLKKRREEANSLCEQIRLIVMDKLLGEGITGDTAVILADTFQEEVIKPFMGYVQESEIFIRKNEEVKEMMEEARQRTHDIASM